MTRYMQPDQRKIFDSEIGKHFQPGVAPGCAAEQYPLVALGEHDLALYERTLAWDHAAGTLWLEEAGGKAARNDGSPYRVDEWDRRGLIAAANPAIWQAMAERLNAL